MRISVRWLTVTLALFPAALPAQHFDATYRLCRDATASVAVGDLDGDGDPDLVFGEGRHWPRRNPIVMNGGEGAFLEEAYLPSTTRTYSLALGDIDRDGDLDVVEATDVGDADRVWLNEGTGHFDVGPRLGDEADRHGERVPNRHALVADLDGDGAPDVVTVARGGPDRVHMNDGSGEAFRTQVLESGGGPSIQAAAGDLDGDGDLDLVVGACGANRIHSNAGDGTFPTSETFGSEEGEETVSVAVAEFDGRAGPEIVVGNEGGPNLLYLNDGRGRFPEVRSFGEPRGKTRALVAADVDADGDLDVVVGNEGRGFRLRGARWVTPSLDVPNRVFLNDGFARLTSGPTFGQAGGETRDLAVADLDGDGRPDIVEANNCGTDEVHFGMVPAAHGDDR